MKAAILTYHSQNIAGNDTSSNDHVALAADLEALHSAGAHFVSVKKLVQGFYCGGSLSHDKPLVCLTFDDGCNFDVQTIEYPGFGLQTGFLQIMEQFVERHGAAVRPGLHATSFVIADPQARSVIDKKSLFGANHMSDDWWKEADTQPLLSIANHGWDHNHPDLGAGRYGRGGFEVVDTYDFCHHQVVDAARLIEQKTGRYPDLFCYPFGESSQYMRDVYFPDHQDKHRCLAAFGTEAGFVSEQSHRWNLPRYVCGRDWVNPTELLQLLGD